MIFDSFLYSFTMVVSIGKMSEWGSEDLPTLCIFIFPCCIHIHSPQICQRKIHQCKELVCQCCDHVTCFLKEPRGEQLGFHDLHTEDLNILKLSRVRFLIIVMAKRQITLVNKHYQNRVTLSE